MMLLLKSIQTMPGPASLRGLDKAVGASDIVGVSPKTISNPATAIQ